MRQIINVILKLFYSLYSYESKKTIIEIWYRLYTAWIRNAFASTGNIRIEPSLCMSGGKSISIGNNCGFGKDGHLFAYPDRQLSTKEEYPILITIGNNVWIGDNFNITAAYGVSIGDNVLMGKWVSILDNDHGCTDLESLKQAPLARLLSSKGSINISDNVWVGDKVTILSGVKIGKGSVVASNAVVTKDVPPYCVVGGVPAKIIKTN